jgi:hypothetical protein
MAYVIRQKAPCVRKPAHPILLRLVAPSRTGKKRALFRCECGREFESSVGDVNAGKTSSCGCFRRAVAGRTLPHERKHGHAVDGKKSPIYRAWQAMLSRCLLVSHPFYYLYGAKGVTVCERWFNFENFLSDMGPKPDGMSIDRYPDNNGNYEPENCRWATVKEQNRNLRNNRRFEFRGMMLTVQEIAEMPVTTLDHYIIFNRLMRGWDIEDAISRPVRAYSRSPIKAAAFPAIS